MGRLTLAEQKCGRSPLGLFTALAFAVMIGPAPLAAQMGQEGYDVLLARAKANPSTADFAKLRLAFTRTESYRQYPAHAHRSYPEEDKTLDTAMRENNLTRALEIINSLLEKNYVRIKIHFLAMAAYGRLGDKARSQYHQTFHRGLAKSILSSGDGRTPATAFVVIDTDEEYDVLVLLGLGPLQPSRIQEGERHFDLWKAERKGQAEPVLIYFDITLPLAPPKG